MRKLCAIDPRKDSHCRSAPLRTAKSAAAQVVLGVIQKWDFVTRLNALGGWGQIAGNNSELLGIGVLQFAGSSGISVAG
jgi:hypothetical protein